MLCVGGEASLVAYLLNVSMDACRLHGTTRVLARLRSIVVSTVSFHLRVEIDVTRYEAYLIVGDGNPANDEETTVEVSVCTYICLCTNLFF